MGSRSLKAALQSTKKKRSNSRLYRYFPAITLFCPVYLAPLPHMHHYTKYLFSALCSFYRCPFSAAFVSCCRSPFLSVSYRLLVSFQFPYKHTNIRFQCYGISCGFITTAPASLNLYLGNYVLISNDSDRWLSFNQFNLTKIAQKDVFICEPEHVQCLVPSSSRLPSSVSTVGCESKHQISDKRSSC